MEPKRIVVIGSGNVATHLAAALDHDHEVVQVYSHTLEHAKSLAHRLRQAQPTDDLANIMTDADYYIISVKDDAIIDVAQALPDVTGIVAHTSGSVGIEALGRHRAAVMYPLQTFSRQADVDVSEVPFFVEGTDSHTLNGIEALARSISGSVYHADSGQRKVLHIAAVFGCNFVNHMLDIASQILNEGGYTLEVLKPLLGATIGKAMAIGPHNAQTGPAARKDIKVIDSHIASLTPDRAEIYRLITEHIINGELT